MHNLNDTKQLTDSYRAISAVALRKAAPPRDRDASGQLLALGSIKLRLVQDPLRGDWYLELPDGAINLQRTRCHFGGYREWFECPGCERRSGVLYQHEDEFRCRKCLNLAYFSQRMNYYSLLPTFKHLMEFEKMDPGKCRFYSGKPTRYTRRYEKLRAQIAFGMEFIAPRLLKK